MNELKPVIVDRIKGQVKEVACGDEHSVVLDRQGVVWVMGSNSSGQLGLDSVHKGEAVPIKLKELQIYRITKVRAGMFSLVLSQDG